MNWGAPGLFSSGWNAYSFDQCTDGLSNTLLFGETMPAREKDFMLFHSHYVVATTNLPPNQYRLGMMCDEFPSDWIANDCHHWGLGYNSHHSGGVQVAMADGSVHFASETIDYPIWVYLGNRADNEIAVLP